MPTPRDERGFVLVTSLLLLALLMSLLLGYFVLTRMELTATRSSLDGTRGFYASEAGLNIRAEAIRQRFLGYNRPTGTSPSSTGGSVPCAAGNTGSGDLQCASYSLDGRSASTYVTEDAGNPIAIVIPRGELYQDLSAQEYGYRTFSLAANNRGGTEAILEMHFKSRLVPMFQFSVFYNKDLEILPGQNMSLSGPVHTNGDLYLGSETGKTLDINGQVTSVGHLYRGRKNANTCMTGAARVYDPASALALPACASGRLQYGDTAFSAWRGMIRPGVDMVTVPEPEVLDPTPGQTYWDKSDLRIVLDLNGGSPAVQVRKADGTVSATLTAALSACSGAAGTSNTLYNNRESETIRMLDVDLQKTLNCIHQQTLLGAGKGLDDTSEGGLVFYLGVDGPSSSVVNGYGVRVKNGGTLASTISGAPAIKGLTVVTNQAVYVQGSYNSTGKKPAAFLADSLNILSNAWSDANSTSALSSRVATSTTVNAAFLAGTDSTGGAEGTAGRDAGSYNGGVENYPRLHEKWSSATLTYRGSFVSLGIPRHVSGTWVYGSPQYEAPTRAFSYDTDFNDASKLPPLSPRFVYLRQDLFVRQFGQ